ncbi:polysaccharide deacetylase family protein [Modestobacter sp. SYSU DS0290]
MTRGLTRSRVLRLVAPALLGALVVGGAAPASAGAPPWAGGKVTDEIVTTTQQGGRTLALTFDDGPDPEDTPALLEVLRRHHVTAVFCLWGDHVRQHPELVAQIAADGHVLCNHTMTHADLSTWTPEQIRADLAATTAVIRQAAPGAELRYFRAPYGSWGQSAQVAAGLGLQPLGWGFDVGDWEEPGADVLVQRAYERMSPRDVALLHDGGGDRSGTVEAVDRLITELRAQGWRFTLPARR